jgi:hypothetical protein
MLSHAFHAQSCPTCHLTENRPNIVTYVSLKDWVMVNVTCKKTYNKVRMSWDTYS